MIDPLIPLASSMAVGRGVYAFFLGSGVSQGAEVPTGGEIFWETWGQLYRLVRKTEEVPEDTQLDDWYQQSPYRDFTYSKILEKVFPEKDAQRRYLEQFFKDREPSEAHQLLAQLVSQGYVRVIVTTNFDDLMEQALHNIGQGFDVVADEKDLVSVCPREQSTCRLVKLHGDWRRLNMKNTDHELEFLEPALEQEFLEIINRYGLVVLGYSGSDKGVMRCLKQRQAPHALYWMAREERTLCGNAKKQVEAQGGYLILRPSADAMLRELGQMIHLVSTQPRRDTPETLAVKTEDALREGDKIGLDRLIQQEVSLFLKECPKKIKEAEGIKQNEEIRKIFSTLQDLSDRLIAIGLALMRHRAYEPLKRLTRKLEVISNVFTGQTGGVPPIAYAPFALLHNILHLWGALATSERDIETLEILLSTQVSPPYETIPRKIWRIREIPRYNDLWQLYGQGRNSLSAVIEYWRIFLERYSSQSFILRYFISEEEFRSAVVQFSFILSIVSAKQVSRHIFSEETGDYMLPDTLEDSEVQELVLPKPGLHGKSVRSIMSLIAEIKTDETVGQGIASLCEQESREAFCNNLPKRLNWLHKLLLDLDWSNWARKWGQLIGEIKLSGLL